MVHRVMMDRGFTLLRKMTMQSITTTAYTLNHFTQILDSNMFYPKP